MVLVLFGLLALSVRVLANATATGYLISFNEYTSVLASAPACFRSGCGSSNLTTMASGCETTAPCFSLWSMLNQQHQKSNDWCSRASGDPACRIKDWPVLNATAVCAASQQWQFGNPGGCCSSPSDAIVLGTWFNTMCNGSWQEPFNFYGHMALIDWWQWLLPWNWTVRPESPDGTPIAAHCPDSPRYLGLFVIENFFFLLFVVAFTCTKLWWIKAKRSPHPIIARGARPFFATVTRIQRSIAAVISKCLCLNEGSSGAGAAISTIIQAIVLSGLQLAVNFATAYNMKRVRGYEHVPYPLLALVFCARPRIGWIVCLIAGPPGRRLIRYFNFSNRRDAHAAELIISKLAISSSVSELIMQFLGSYALGRTANDGVHKGFYLIHHLWPYWRGKEARIMYLGALFWLISCVGIVLIWGTIVYWYSTITQGVRVALNFLKSTGRRTRRRLAGRRSNRGNQQVLPVNDSNTEQDRLLSGEGLNEKVQRNVDGTTTMRGGDNRIRNLVDTDQPMRPGHFQAGSGPRPAGYTTVPLDIENMQMRPGDFAASPITSSEQPSSAPQSNRALSPDDDTIHEVGSSNAARDQTPYAPTATTAATAAPITTNPQRQDTTGTVETAETAPEDELDENEPRLQELPEVLRDGEGPILALGVIIGLVSYIAQWLFWGGFVNTSGTRFCPPSLGPTVTIWTLGSLIGLGSTYASF